MIILLGLKPVFVDLKPRTYNIDEKDLLTKIGPNSRVLLVTHLCGLVTDMAPIVDICKKKSILLVEDCSQASGARYNGRLLGTFGLAGIFSLSFMKTLSTLDGGMIISNDSALIDKLRRLTEDLPLPPKPFMLKSLVKNIAFKLATDRIIFSLITYTTIRFMNCFMKDIFEKLQRGNPSPFLRTEFPGEMCFKYTDLQAEMGLVQLSRLDEYNQRRIANAKFLIDSLARHNSILPLTPKNSESIFWLFPLYILDSKTFRNFLFERGVDTGMFLLFVCSSLPCFNQWVMVTEIAEETKEHTVFIPIHSFLDEADMKKIASAINQYLKAQA
jgi:dTDP-4-amino-4,6-dideoxygalactose transaminase